MADTLREEFEIWARDLFGKFYPLTKDEDGYKDKVTRFAYMAFKAGRVSRPTDAEVWVRVPGSIGAQEFLRWNRSQSIPLVAIPMEMGVYRKAIEIHKATEIGIDTARMSFIEKNAVQGATYRSITSANILVYENEWHELGLRGAIDAAISRTAHAENKENGK